jgi:hypothetical protein
MKASRFLCFLLTVLVACSSTDEPEQPGKQDFSSTMARMCSRLSAKTASAQAAPNEAEFAERTRQLLGEQERFLEEASRLVPPKGVQASFRDYLAAIKDIVSLNRRSLNQLGEGREGLEVTLGAAESGVRALDSKKRADLPTSCPPPSAGEAYSFLFLARANVMCFSLGADLERLGRLQTEADTPEETMEIFELGKTLALSLASGLRQSVPSQLKDPGVERLIALHEDRAKFIGEIRQAFIRKDRATYDQAARSERNSAEEADQLARSMGLTECVGFLRIIAD